jgi:hypothetical protein
VPVAPAVAGALPVLADDDLLAEHVLGHGRLDLDLHVGSELRAVLVAAHEEHVRRERGALFLGNPVHEQPLALADAVLLPSDADDRVRHGFSRKQAGFRPLEASVA